MIEWVPCGNDRMRKGRVGRDGEGEVKLRFSDHNALLGRRAHKVHSLGAQLGDPPHPCMPEH